MTAETLPGKEECPGHLTWSAFGASYPDTVCASALNWPEGHEGYGLCDADDGFRPKDVPCPFCDPDGFIDWQWAVGDGESAILWGEDESLIAADTEIHFHDGQALWWTATHPERGEERVLFISLTAESASLDAAVRVAKARAGLNPGEKHAPADFIDHLDEEWRRPFWDRQIGRVIAAETPQVCRECSPIGGTKHGACNGSALVDDGMNILEVDCLCADRGHA